ncbi:hypothetical protein ASZ78_016722 [Callipepla squamata]|uniref:AH domain-containing protein n=1 Tax=Callipepla squamata TaxID=9009 RepID=A0A226NJ90_CALSU|nr:hypothetical protein ASZ78_016722 [Callipepla squamata]
MEQYRTEYRGALLWMKDVSQELDPDLYKQMEKFRKWHPPAHCTSSHHKYITTLHSGQQILADSLVFYDALTGENVTVPKHNIALKFYLTLQTTLLHFWEKTSHTMAAIHESFKGYQPYEFTMLKSLQDPVNKLRERAEKEDLQTESTKSEDQQSQLISLDEESHTKEPNYSGAVDDLLDLQPEENASKDQFAKYLEAEPSDKDDMVLLNEILNASSLEEGEFSKEWTAVFGQVALTDLATNSSAADGDNTSAAASAPSGYLPSQLLDQNMNDLQSSLHGWAANSGSPLSVPQPAQKPNSLNVNANKTPMKGATFSQFRFEIADKEELQVCTFIYVFVHFSPEPTRNPKDLTAWFSLFADLDPLSNPDAVGKTDKEHELLNA